jgi:hypothetical protein
VIGTVVICLYVAAFICCLISAAATPRLPLWVAVLLVVIAELLEHIVVHRLVS